MSLKGGACFQHKMSLKAITATTAGQGTLRGNVDYHAACRTSHADPDAAVSRSRRHAQLRRDRPQAGLRADRTYPTRLPIPRSVQEGQRHRALLLGQGQRTQPLANHPFDRPLARARRPRAARFETPPLPAPLHARRYRSVSRRRARKGLSAPAIRRILERECKVYGKTAYQRLAAISPSHIYNLRRTRAYREHHVHHTKTRAAAVSIGERRKPDPRGRAGWLRVDTVHQGDTDSSKGLYHINAVDTVTQWVVVGCCETISEAHLKPVLEAMLHQFPFLVRGFHSDNGSEFLNYRVARLLEKMRVEEFTKSRAHRSTDNALVEGKNGAVVRKHIGHEPIAVEHAEKLQRFYAADFNPYLNYHRPCGFATVETASNGKRRRRYRLADYRTPREKLLSLDELGSCLKPGITVAFLEQQAGRMSDTECALRMQRRKRELLDECRSRR